MEYEEVRLRVDDSTILGADPSVVIEPVWWTGDIYDGPQKYQLSLASFSLGQRGLYGLMWYRSEVNNGGHDQFYFNSTGIVWRQARDGFDLLGLKDFFAVLNESLLRLGGDVPLDRDKRTKLLDSLEPDFSDLDSKFYDLQKQVDLDHRMMVHIRHHLDDFRFDGVVRRPSRKKR